MAKSPARPKSSVRIKPTAGKKPRSAGAKPLPKPKQTRGPGGDAELLGRIAGALERLAPTTPAVPDFSVAEAFVWHPEERRLTAVRRVNRVDMSLLKGIDRVRDLLVENTE